MLCSQSYLAEPYAPRLRLGARSTPRAAGPSNTTIVQMGANNCSFPVPDDVPEAFQGIIGVCCCAGCVEQTPLYRTLSA
jgi:hypothetical protein